MYYMLLMPYHRLPRTIVKELATMAARTYNSFPHPDGISDTITSEVWLPYS
jgi:hypothetical protein